MQAGIELPEQSAAAPIECNQLQSPRVCIPRAADDDGIRLRITVLIQRKVPRIPERRYVVRCYLRQARVSIPGGMAAIRNPTGIGRRRNGDESDTERPARRSLCLSVAGWTSWRSPDSRQDEALTKAPTVHPRGCKSEKCKRLKTRSQAARGALRLCEAQIWRLPRC